MYSAVAAGRHVVVYYYMVEGLSSSGLSIPSSGARDGYTTGGRDGGRESRGVSHRRSRSVTAGGVYYSARAEVATDRYIPSPSERDVNKRLATKNESGEDSTYDRKTTTCSTSAAKKERAAGAAVAAVLVTGGVGRYLKRPPAFDIRLRDRYSITLIYRLLNNNIASLTKIYYIKYEARW